MKSLEQDALKAQMVIAKSRDGKKRGTLDQLTESPSPAPTPSPTPMEGKKLLLKETVFVFSPKKLIFHPTCSSTFLCLFSRAQSSRINLARQAGKI